MKDKDREKTLASFRKRQQDAARREAAGARRMQELMRQIGTILRQVKKITSASILLRVFLLLSNQMVMHRDPINIHLIICVAPF